MNKTHWREVEHIFNTVVHMSYEEQQTYLQSIQTVKREIYNDVVSLLSADELKEILPVSRADFDYATRPDLSAPGNAAEIEELNANKDSEPDFSLVGEIVGGRYHLIKRLGSGGMGEVYLAQDKNVMNRESVIKLLKAEILSNREVVRKFKQEIEALSRLRHQGVVTILDSGTHGRQPFLALEYVDGEDLSLIISPVLFSVRDFLNPRRTAERLLRQETSVDCYFLQKFSLDGRKSLEANLPDAEIAKILRDEFTSILSDTHLINHAIIAAGENSVSTKVPSDVLDFGKAVKANRAFIEEVFSDDVARGKNKKLNHEEAALLFRQLGESLTHGHNKGIIHRDLKPANIMITHNERGELQTKLIDFGVAKVHESLIAPSTEIGLSFGTRKYMSPEQVNGQSILSPATDIYALGLIAFEALTGHHAFNTQSFIEQCRLQELEAFSDISQFRPDLTSDVKDIICRALSFKPENRQSSAAEFGRLLADALIASSPTDGSIETGSTAQKATEIEPAVTGKSPDINADQSKSKAVVKILAAAFLGLIILGAGGIFLRQYIQSGATPISANTGSEVPAEEKIRRELNYRLIVQKYYEGKPFQTPFAATGDEIFGDEWRFRMVIDSPQSGFLYLLTENPKTNNLRILFPHPQKNNGAAQLSANEKIETAEMSFDKNQGSEKLWLVWSEKPVKELESVKSYVNSQDLGDIKDAEKEKSVRAFLDKAVAEGSLKEKTSVDKQSKNLQSTTGILVKMAEFRHN